MKKLTPDDIEPLARYAERRAEAQRAAIALRLRRRLAVGDRVSLAFENRDTVRYQVQEMCHAERIASAEGIAHEVATYNQLIPDEGQLSTTLMIEITAADDVRPELDKLIGLDRPGILTMRIGAHTAPSEWEPGHSREDRIAAVQYVRFRLSPAARQGLASGAEALAVIAHPHYQATARIGDDLRRELIADLEA